MKKDDSIIVDRRSGRSVFLSVRGELKEKLHEGTR